MKLQELANVKLYKIHKHGGFCTDKEGFVETITNAMYLPSSQLYALIWQIDDGWYSPGLYAFFMEFINIGPVYIREWAGGVWSGGKSLNREEIRHKE